MKTLDNAQLKEPEIRVTTEEEEEEEDGVPHILENEVLLLKYKRMKAVSLVSGILWLILLGILVIGYELGWFMGINGQLKKEEKEDCTFNHLQYHNNNGSINVSEWLRYQLENNNEYYGEESMNVLAHEIFGVATTTTTANEEEESEEEINRRRLAGTTAIYGSTYSDDTFELKEDFKNIKTICVRSGLFIDAIQVIWEDNTESVMEGGSGGGLHCMTSTRDCFVGANIRAGSYIDSLQFITSQYTTGPYWGGGGGLPYSVNWEGSSESECLRGVMGTIKDNYIESIQFFYEVYTVYGP